MLTQCLLQHPNGSKQTAWIESRGAHVGKSVELKDTGERWNVMEVYGSLPDEVVKKNERNYRNHRDGSDI